MTALSTCLVYVFVLAATSHAYDDECYIPLLDKAQLTATTSLPERGPKNARLNGGNAWTAGSSDFGQYLIIDLGQVMNVTGVATQGRSLQNEYVMEYRISYGTNGLDYVDFKEEDGHAKLGFTGDSAWSPVLSSYDQHLTMELGDRYQIRSIATRGRAHTNEYVTEYIVQYSDDGQAWASYESQDGVDEMFKGNVDGDRIKLNKFEVPIIAQWIRINPTRWRDRISLRVELYGCDYVSDVVAFNGSSLVRLDLLREPIETDRHFIRFRFKTNNADGVLMYSRGTQGDYIALQLRDNRMLLNIDLGSGIMTSLSVGSLLDDNMWHDVLISRNRKNISFSVDRVLIKGRIKGQFHRLDLNRELYIGGVPNKQDGLVVNQNFTGCIENFYLNSTNIIRELKEMEIVDENLRYYKINTLYTCPEPPVIPVTFLTPGSFARLKGYEGIPSMNVSLAFRTYEERGIILYHRFTTPGYVELYLEEGKLKVDIKTKDNPFATLDNFYEKFNDGKWHQVILTIAKNSLILNVDGRPMKTERLLDMLTGAFYMVGGMTGAGSNHGFVGCMRMISIDGNYKLPTDWKEEEYCCKNEVVFDTCQMVDRCNPNPCKHFGVCRQNSDEFFCDCANTGYAGAVCHTSLSPLSCEAYKNMNSVNQRAEIKIDVDGSGPLKPFPVTCEFFSDGRVMTVLRHSNEHATPVDGFEEPGSFIQDINYDADLDQIEALLNRSINCRQRINYACKHSKLFNSPVPQGDYFRPNSWWVSRNNQKMDYWGGALPGSRKCECGILGNCADPTKWCNCDAGLEGWLEDGGDITEKEYLPVKQLRFGDTGTPLDEKEGRYTLGPLVCEGDVIINGVKNEAANASVTAALKALREKYPDHLGNVWSAQINESDSSESLDIICDIWGSAVSRGGSAVPDLVLDVTRAGPGSEVSNSFTAAMGIPTLSAQYGQEGDIRNWRDLNLDQKNYLIQVMTPGDLMPEAIRQLAIQMNITNAGILFDKSFIMNHKYKSLLLNVPTRHVINELQLSFELIKEQLARMRDLDVVNYFIMGEEKSIAMVLDVGESLTFTGRKYGWFVFSLDDESWPTCPCENMTVLFLKPQSPMVSNQSQTESVARTILPKPFITSAFYYDLTLLGVRAMKSALDNGDWPLEPRQIDCNIYNKTNTPTRGLDFFSKLVATSKNMTPTYAGINWGKKNGEHSADFKVNMYLVNIEREKISLKVLSGEWQAGIEMPLQITNEEIMNNSAVTSYRVVVVQHPPFVMYDNETNHWFGFCIDLLDAIRETVPFEYEIREVEDGKYGSLDENGSWDGLIRELIDKRADIALSSLWVMAEREKVVDFTVPYYDLVGLTIMMQKTKTSTSLFKFLTVLERDVWLCILAAYFFTSFLMWAFDRWSPYSYQNNREKYKDDEEKREFNLRECFWFCMTSLTPQGGGEAPKNLSGRLVAATWWLFGFIIIASYTANLAAFLTVSRLEIPIETLEDLSKQYKIQYAPTVNSPAYVYFQRMADIEARFYEIWKDMSLNDSLSDVERAKLAVWDYPVSDKYTKMFQAMKEAGFPTSMDDALKRIRRQGPYANNEFAFVGDASTIKYLVLTNCDLTQVGEEFSRKPYAVAVQQGSPLKDQFNNAILILLNKRRLEKLKDRWWKHNPVRKNCDLENDQSDGISIHNIGGVFLVIFVGIVFACFTLAFEYWYYRYRGKVSDLQKDKDKSFKTKVTKAIKPIRFNLHPAPTHAFKSVQFRSRF